MLEKIMRTYYDEIFRYCWHHVGSRAAAEDLCQDTFVSFIEHYEEYHRILKMKNCLYTIAKNKCRDYYKKQVPLLVETVPERTDGSSMEDDIVMQQMILALPEELKEAVILRYLQNLKYKDIAAVLNISPSLAKYRVKRALAQLSEMERGIL